MNTIVANDEFNADEIYVGKNYALEIRRMKRSSDETNDEKTKSN